jgi:protein TonB
MELRALLFTSDGGCTATLCHVLDELGVQAEICPELLVAVGRISNERYDAILVDWTQETEAAVLLKTAREKKVQALNVALVSDETSVGRALQQGANSVIQKPVDAAAARDTLSTARDLILSRRSEQREKEARVAAAQAQLQEQAHEQDERSPEIPVIKEAAAKSGFLQQSMPRSAFEAEQSVVKPVYEPPTLTSFQVARGPSSIEEAKAEPAPPPEPVSKKRWDEVRAVFRETPEEPKPETPAPPAHETSLDSTGVFSSLADEAGQTEESHEEATTSSPPRYVVFAVVACLAVAAILYVWAPGHSYLGKLAAAFHAFRAKSKSDTPPTATAAPAPSSQEATEGKPPAGIESAAADDLPVVENIVPDPPPVAAGEIDPSKIQIIETKVIPRPGAQLPVKDAPADPKPAQPATLDATQPSTAAGTPQTAIAAATEPTPSVQPPPAPIVAPEPRPQSPATPPQATPGEGRTGVIIPDSLRNSPAPSPASSLEPSSVPEDISLGLLIHRVEPSYPQQALSQHLEGPVVLQAWIARDGTVRDLKLVKGYFVLGRAAFDAVKQWRFKPYTANGKAIDFQTVVTVNFKYPN